jgi:hypothetical protein
MDGFARDVSEWPNVPGVATPLSIASGGSFWRSCGKHRKSWSGTRGV